MAVESKPPKLRIFLDFLRLENKKVLDALLNQCRVYVPYASALRWLNDFPGRRNPSHNFNSIRAAQMAHGTRKENELINLKRQDTNRDGGDKCSRRKQLEYDNVKFLEGRDCEVDCLLWRMVAQPFFCLRSA
jgi:hypothetical protein